MTDLGSNATFYVNLCRDILYDKTGLRNAFGIGVYEELGTNNGRIVGRVARTPTFRGDRLLLRYTDGDECPGGGLLKRSSLIAFSCDRTASYDVCCCKIIS